MKLTVTILLLLPAALAHPSFNGHRRDHSHSYHGSEAYKSGHQVSGGPFPSGSAGPYGMSNATASQADTAIGNAESAASTGYTTLYNTIYQTVSESPSESEAASVAPAGSCGDTTTLTVSANTVTVTVTGGENAEAATTGAPETQAPVITSSSAPEVVQPPIQTSKNPAPVVPVSQVAAPTVATPSVEASSSTPTAETATSPAAEAVTVSPSTPISSAPAESQSASIVPAPSSAVQAPSSAAPAESQGATTSATPESPTPQAPSAAPPGSKRGLFIPISSDSTQSDYVTAFNNNPGKISWIVNQFSGPPGGLSSKFNYVPQMYDKFSDESKPGEAPHPWTTNAQKAVAAGEKYFLSFGEPNTNNSQNFYMDPPTAAQEFITALQPYAINNGVNVGAPGTLGSPLDIGWQNDFLDECAKLKCKISWISAHWFSKCGDATAQDLADTFYGTVNDYKAIAQNHSSQYGIDLKVWVDNFSLDCKSQTQQEFLDIVVPKMDADDMIERYGYVSITDVSQGNGFINGDGSISDLGLHYANK